MNLINYFIFLVFFFTTAISLQGQVMISQYIETNSGSTPKGIEVYNHTATTIDFSVDNLEVFQGTNGTACASIVNVNSGILGPYQVWVIGTSDLTAAAMTGSDIAGVTTFGFIFNGDDALELNLDGDLMDVIGTCGSDPGSAWSGSGVSTANQNIEIKSGICSGTTTSWTDPSLRYNNIAVGSETTGFGEAPSCNPNSIATTFATTSINVDCTTSYSGTVDFTSVGVYSNNTFTVQLSDMNGSFINALEVGSTSLSGTDPSGSIAITIPSNYNAGSRYRVRVISSNPSVNGSNNGSDIQIINSTPCEPTIPDFGGILLNEFSNGPSGSQEYYELIVAGECGETTDIRGYIIDDNNGDFGDNGISTGHLKIADHIQWSDIAVGSIIVVYNSSSGGRNPHIPVDDLTDTNSDSVFVIPFDNDTYLSISYEFPTPLDSSYSPDINPPGLTSYENTLGFNNSSDAAQTRKPNGDYFFGISYGVANHGGPDNTKIANSNLTNTNVYFNSGDFRNINNWSTGTADSDPLISEETPGAANSNENQEWIDMLRSTTGNCGLVSLPVSVLKFDGEYNDGNIEISWKIASELNTDFYELFHSESGNDFKSIAIVKGSGSHNSAKHYGFEHPVFTSGIHYYKLKSVDVNGSFSDKGTISVQVNNDKVYYDSNTQTLYFPSKEEHHIYSTSGQRVLKVNDQEKVLFYKKGFYFIYNVESGDVTKMVIN